ncbi:MAG: hypothetical protein V8S75_00010 [[Ruminococcus] torques]
MSGGTQYKRCNKIIPCHGEEEFTNLKEARAIKAITGKTGDYGRKNPGCTVGGRCD